MSETGRVEDPLAGWDPRRRSALERLWQRFQQASGGARLSDQVIADRRREAAASDTVAPRGGGHLDASSDGEESAGG